MHIMFVLAGLGAGGAERVVALISAQWAAAGHNVSVLAFDEASAPIFHAFDSRVSIRRLNVPVRRGFLGIIDWLRRARLLRCEFRQNKPAVVFSFLTKINAISLLAGLGLRLPVVVAERNNPLRQNANRGWNLMLGVLYPTAAAVVLQTEASKVCLPSSVNDRTVIIPNPVEVPPAPLVRGTGDRRAIVAVGRLSNQKGFDLLLQAFAKVATSRPTWQLTIWGEGPDRGALQELATTLGISDRVTLPGLSSHPLGWTERADIFVLSSRYEGFPNALAEAMAAGIACVSFDCPFGPSDMIRPGESGLLVPVGNVEALAKAVGALMDDAALRQQLGDRAHMSARVNEPSRVFAQWESVRRDVQRIAPILIRASYDTDPSR